MSERIEPRIVQLSPLRVASFHGFGPSPEDVAVGKAREWAQARGLFRPESYRRHYGFDNPMPSPGSPNYGYEVWFTLDADEDAGEGVKVIDHPGGLYAVARCFGVERIGERWHALADWACAQGYRIRNSECLEEAVNYYGGDPLILDLYLAIAR